MSINKLYDKINELETTSGKNDKLLILKKYKDDEDFRYALNFLLNPFILTRISTKKINKEIEPFNITAFGNHDFNDIKNLMAYLRSQSTGTDYNVYVAQHFINKQETDDLKEFVTKLVTKTLKLGVSEKSVNKIYGKGTIPSFGVMLAESYEKKESKVKGAFYITLKLDGNRCVAVNEEEGVKFFTRKGQPILGMTGLESQFKELPKGLVYDGELLLINKDNLPSDELFRATQKVVRKDGEKKDLEFHVFDSLPIKEFFDGKSKKTYEQRRNTLDLMFNHFNDGQIQSIHLLPVLYRGTDKNMISVLMKWAEAGNHEGLMVNSANGLYVTKRTDNLMKVKKFKTADLLVMSFEKAIDGQFKDLLARVNVEYKGSMVGVGSGFTIEERRQFTENPDLIVGRIIEVQYFEESKDEKTGEPSLRFPVFKGIRHDKGLEDVNYE